MIASSLAASEKRVYLGCKDGIYLTALDLEKGRLQPVRRVASSENTSFLALSTNGDFLYSVVESQPGEVVAWRVSADGSLTEINRQPSGGAQPTHLTITPAGNFLLAANYTGGSVAAFLIQKDGSISPKTAFIQLTGSGPDPKRQESPHAHGIYSDPSGKWVYCIDLGTDKAWIFQLDALKGTLAPADPAFASLPPGSGSRHLAFSTDGKYAFINGEMGLGVTSLKFESATGALQVGATTPAFPPEFKQPADTAEVVAHPDGKYLYLSTRGYSSLSTFQIAENGELTLIANTPIRVQGPRHFSCSPDGKWLVVPGQNSNQVEVLAVDPKTGKLTSSDSLIEAGSPMCAVFSHEK